MPKHTPAEKAKNRAASRPINDRARQARDRANLTPGISKGGPIISPPVQRDTVGPTGPKINPVGIVRKKMGARKRRTIKRR